MEKKARLGRRFLTPRQYRSKQRSTSSTYSLRLQHDGSVDATELGSESKQRKFPKWMSKLPGNRKEIRRIEVAKGGLKGTEQGKTWGKVEEATTVEGMRYGYERMRCHSNSMVGDTERGSGDDDAHTAILSRSSSTSGSTRTVLRSRAVLGDAGHEDFL